MNQAVVLLLVFIGFVVIVDRSSPLQAKSWVPPFPLPSLVENVKLKSVEKVPVPLLGPESLAIKGNYLYTGLMDGRIVRLDLTSLKVDDIFRFNSSCKAAEPPQTVYENYPPELEPLCGRPLGLRFDVQGRLLVIESYSGLYRLTLNDAGLDVVNVELIVNSVQGRKITLANDVDVASDGTIFFTESSDRWYVRTSHFCCSLLTLKENYNRGRNRIISEILATRPVGTLVQVKGQHVEAFGSFLPCNGLTLSHDEKVVFFVSSPRIYRFDRLTQTISIALDNAPCLMDNIRKRKHSPNRFLVGCASKRALPLSIPDLLAPFPMIRNILGMFLPQHILLKFIKRMGMLMEVELFVEPDRVGRVVQTFQDPQGETAAYVSEAEEAEDGYTYLGTWHESNLWRIPTKELFSDLK